MNVSLTPMLGSLREIYDVDGVMPRFQAYLSLMLGDARGEAFPLGVFSPMGRRQPDYLDALIALGAESIAKDAAEHAAERLASLPENYRLLLVVVDEKPNSWTQRYITDAEWRLQNKYDEMPQNAKPVGFDRWITVQLWTDVVPTAQYLQQETQASIYRAAYRKYLGEAKTLGAMMHQEGQAMAFAGYKLELDDDDLEYSRQVIAPYQQSTDYAICFAALYGDEIARALGYQALGLSPRAGFNVGLADALEHGAPEGWLKAQKIR